MTTDDTLLGLGLVVVLAVGAGRCARGWAGGAPGRLMVDAVSRETELEEVTDALLLTRYDDFNALAAAELRVELGHARVYRVAPDPHEGDLAAPPGELGIVANAGLTYAELDRRLSDGARRVAAKADAVPRTGGLPLFAVSPSGGLRVATGGAPLVVRTGETLVALSVDGRAG